MMYFNGKKEMNTLKFIINKLKSSMRKFLGIDDLSNNLIAYKSRNDGINSDLRNNLRKNERSTEENQNSISILQKTLKNIVSIGSDISFNGSRDQSWAVVCIEGKYNVVKFLNLSKKDADEVLKVLRSFEGGRFVNDTPMGYLPKDMFVNSNRYR